MKNLYRKQLFSVSRKVEVFKLARLRSKKHLKGKNKKALLLFLMLFPTEQGKRAMKQGQTEVTLKI